MKGTDALETDGQVFHEPDDDTIEMVTESAYPAQGMDDGAEYGDQPNEPNKPTPGEAFRQILCKERRAVSC